MTITKDIQAISKELAKLAKQTVQKPGPLSMSLTKAHIVDAVAEQNGINHTVQSTQHPLAISG